MLALHQGRSKAGLKDKPLIIILLNCVVVILCIVISSMV